MNNIIYDCFHGIGYKNAADPTIINNTIVGCNFGVVLFQKRIFLTLAWPMARWSITSSGAAMCPSS